MESKNPNPDLILGDNSKPEYLAQGIEWLLKMGAVDSPDVQTALTANIYVISDLVEDVAIVADMEALKLLIYIKLTKPKPLKFHNKVIGVLKGLFGISVPEIDEMTSQDIGNIAADKIAQALPNYDIRITFSHELYNKSKEISEKLKKLRGGLS